MTLNIGRKIMSVHIPSNTTPEEFFKYYCTDENAKEFYQEALDDLIDYKHDEYNELEIENDVLEYVISELEDQIATLKEQISELEKETEK